MALWIFGYGSLIFRPEFAFSERCIARLRGYERRFWQRSPDHRGTPEAPGRVVTLIESPRAIVLGMAYRVAPEHASTVLDELDHRERAGYERVEVDVELEGSSEEPTRAVVYHARLGNPGFVTGETEAEIAAVVRAAVGPSGDNASYVRRLATALRELGADDPHVFAIERLLGETQ